MQAVKGANHYSEARMEGILKEIFESVLSGEADSVTGKVQDALKAELPAEDILSKGLILAMDEVGARFEKKTLYVPEMLMSAKAMKSAVSILKPLLVESDVKPAGKVLIGTVKGDLHDIGKNLVAMMLEGAGFEVIDLGTDIAPQDFAAAVREVKPDVVGMSALLTTTMSSMKATIEALEDIGVRDDVKIIVGGAPVTNQFAIDIGADGYGADAGRAVQLSRELMSD
jgi:5-methyltetrahydrofolate--homocysteine methyltransferase